MFKTQPTQQDVGYFLNTLHGRGWVKGRQLVQELTVNKRHLRALAECSGGLVISGNEGYRLTVEAAQSEIEKCCKRLSSQARKTLRRCEAIRSAKLAASNSSSPTNPF